jgi:hypothetical protein
MTWGEFGWLVTGILYGYFSFPVISILKKVYRNTKKASNE